MRAADADDLVVLGVVERGAEPDAGLGARVARRERGAEARRAPRAQRGRGRAAADDDGPHARQVEGVEVGIPQHQRELRRDAGDGRHPLLGEHAQRVATPASAP